MTTAHREGAVRLRTAATAHEYAEAVAEFAEGGGFGPMPVLEGPALARLAGLREASPTATGQVVAGDAEFHPVAAALAAATRRPLWTGSLDEARRAAENDVVTFVVAPGSIGPEELAAVADGGPALGLFTAHDLTAASALAVRCARPGRWTSEDQLLADNVSTPPALLRHGGRQRSWQLRTRALRAETAEPLSLFVARSHSRDCLLHLDDGGICGRVNDDPVLRPPVRRRGHEEQPTSCMLGHGCWRADLPMGTHVRATDIDAAVAVLDGCATLAVSRGRVATEANLALGFLAGSALAVVGAAGARSGPGLVAPILRTMLACGVPLGAAVSELNAIIDAEPSAQGPLVLLGDAGLRLAEPAPLPDGGTAGYGAAVVSSSEGPVLVDHDLDEVLVCPRPGRAEHWVASLDGNALPAPLRTVTSSRDLRAEFDHLGRWTDALGETVLFGAQVPEHTRTTLRRGLSARTRCTDVHSVAAHRRVADQADALRAALTEAQESIVAEHVDTIAATFFSFDDRWEPQVWFRREPGLSSCPQCSARALTDHTVEFPGAPGHLPMTFASCARCGKTASGHRMPDHEIELEWPGDLDAGEPFEVAAAVTNRGSVPSTITVGASIAFLERMAADLRGMATVVVEPGATERVVVRGTHDTGRARSEMQNVLFVVMADGRLATHVRNIWVYA